MVRFIPAGITSLFHCLENWRGQKFHAAAGTPGLDDCCCNIHNWCGICTLRI